MELCTSTSHFPPPLPEPPPTLTLLLPLLALSYVSTAVHFYQLINQIIILFHKGNHFATFNVPIAITVAIGIFLQFVPPSSAHSLGPRLPWGCRVESGHQWVTRRKWVNVEDNAPHLLLDQREKIKVGLVRENLLFTGFSHHYPGVCFHDVRVLHVGFGSNINIVSDSTHLTSELKSTTCYCWN